MKQDRTALALEAIRADLDRCSRHGDRDGILLGLLAAWRCHRSPLLARAIERVALQRCPIPVQTAQDWRELVQRRDPLLLGRLLASPWEQARTGNPRKRLDALARFPADPRIATFARAVAASAEQDRKPGYRAVVEEAERVEQLHADLEGQPELDALVRPLLAAASSGPLREEAELIETVYRALHDDGPRYVYADYLLERGDPLGRYLVAALEPESPQVQLTPEQKAQWCRFLLGEVQADRIELRRGFPYRLRLGSYGHPTAPRWSTLEEVHWEYPSEDNLWVLSLLARAPALKIVHILAQAQQARPWMGEALSVLADYGLHEISLPARAWNSGYLEPRRWPRLARLGFWLHREQVRLDEAFLGALAQRPLEIRLFPWDAGLERILGEVLAARATCAPCISRIRVGGNVSDAHVLEAILERARDFRELRIRGVSRWKLDSLWEMLARVPQGALDRITIETSPPQDADLVARVRGVLEPLRLPEVEFVPPG